MRTALNKILVQRFGQHPQQALAISDLMENVLEERLSTLLTKIFLYQLHSMGGNINSVNVFFSSVPLLLRY